jgi:hypothetical protein
MGTLDEQQERRVHQRLLSKDWIFAVCKSHFVRLGRVVDISRGGIAFHYVPDSSEDRALMKGSFGLEMFETRSSYCLKGVAGTIVYNREVPGQTNLPETRQLMRCGVEFGELSRDQRHQLDFFMNNFTLQEN